MKENCRLKDYSIILLIKTAESVKVARLQRERKRKREPMGLMQLLYFRLLFL
jgi:hypothetical protein